MVRDKLMQPKILALLKTWYFIHQKINEKIDIAKKKKKYQHSMHQS